jgi:hypothetical protein
LYLNLVVSRFKCCAKSKVILSAAVSELDYRYGQKGRLEREYKVSVKPLHKLEYWVAPHKSDARCYWIRAKTRREVDILRWKSGDGDSYHEPTKVVVEYRDSYDILEQCLSEGGLLEEGAAMRAVEEAEAAKAEPEPKAAE